MNFLVLDSHHRRSDPKDCRGYRQPPGMPVAFVSVSLSIASADEEVKTEARNYPVQLSDAGWEPRSVLKYSSLAFSSAGCSRQ